MAFLYQIQADGSRGECWVLGYKPLVIGRDESADVCVDDESLSRSHFLVVRQGVDFFVVDLDSINGTWIDGERVSAHKLQPNDVIMAGQSLFYFSPTPVPAQAHPIIVTLPKTARASQPLPHAA